MAEMISFNYTLAKAIWASLEKQGLEPRKDAVGIISCRFSQEELDMVTSLQLTDVTSLKGISKLKNLKYLSVSCSQRTAYTPPENLRAIESVDVFEIEKLSNLEHLTIDNQPFLYGIDISRFPKLQTLTLTRNENLEEVIGLAENRTLYELTFYSQNNISSLPGLDKFIVENPNLSELRLDVLLYPSAIGYNPVTGKINQTALDRITNDFPYAKWSESILTKTIDINNYQMGKLHSSALEIVSKYCPKGCSDLVSVAAVDRWLAENVTYNHAALDSSFRGVSKGGIVYGPIGGANGAYDALIHKTCVCEGYTRAMQYMLALKGIKTANTHCISGKDKYHMSEKPEPNSIRFYTLPESDFHSICRIERDSGCYYCDSCWDAGHFQRGDTSLPYLLLTKEQISKDHALSFYEQNISHQNPIPDYVRTATKSVVEQTFNKSK